MRKRVAKLIGLAAALLIVGGAGWGRIRLPRREPLHIVFVGKPTQIDPYNRHPYAPNMVAFNLITSNDCSIAVWETGTQWQTENGWETVHEEHRFETWQLTNGIPLQFTVEPPNDGPWRVFIHYGTEMKGLPLLRAQLREAWKLRSFTNWNGNPWVGGRWTGSTRIFSGVVETNSPVR